MDEVAKAYALLSSLKNNIPKDVHVDKSWVDDYHSALRKIEASTGTDLQDFNISPHELERETTGGNYLTHETHYSGRTVIERSRLLVKADAVLTFFQIPKGKIGFRKG